MYVNYNPVGVNALHHLQRNTSGVQQSLQKLSSGYAINKAADNAAGLAVSEKMRAQITGLEQAERNAKDGARLIQTGEGALQEIHTMLNRMVTLATQSANGTYDDTVDRSELQVELDELRSEIDRIAEGTNFNGIKLFQQEGKDKETGSTEGRLQALQAMDMEGQIYTASVKHINQTDQTQRHVHVIVHDAKQAVTGSATSNATGTGNINSVGGKDSPVAASVYDPEIKVNNVDTKLSEILRDDIVPKIVNNILDTYGDAFGYLGTQTANGKDIKIGLEYFNESGSSVTTLAYVGAGFSATSNTNGSLSFTLGVNIAGLDGKNRNDQALTDLESTIAHEMIHAFMDEATTAGMMGYEVNGDSLQANAQNKFPSWFTEGMAQTASGPKNWLKYLGVANNSGAYTNTTIAQVIQTHSDAKLGSGQTASEYGTGYLACMYLGAVLGGYQTSDNANTLASKVETGLNKLMSSIVHGNSLGGTIANLTDCKDINEFQDKFNSGTAVTAKAAGSATVTPDQFISKLIAATGAGQGGLASDGTDGNPLDDTDLVNDTASVTIKNTFKLDTTTQKYSNPVSGGEKLITGGGSYKNGVAPAGYTGSADQWVNKFNGGAFAESTPPTQSGGGIALQIGDTAGQLLEVKTFYLSTEALEIDNISVGKLEDADNAIDKIKDAINTVSDMRGQYGALGNRLEHTINNLTNMRENITDAESTIRDVDVAEEMMKYTKQNILMQSSQAMLSQANQVHQGVLQLIQ